MQLALPRSVYLDHAACLVAVAVLRGMPPHTEHTAKARAFARRAHNNAPPRWAPSAEVRVCTRASESSSKIGSFQKYISSEYRNRLAPRAEKQALAGIGQLVSRDQVHDAVEVCAHLRILYRQRETNTIAVTVQLQT